MSDDDDLPKDLAHITPAYRRALWIVVGLNVGYGLVEMVGGFISGSQALKADALDFLGDGLISFLGLLAIGWSLAWRARSALIQGLFLAVLGVGVLATTGYRVLVLNQPEAELMGLFGAVALVVNVASAAVLMPHREGDAQGATIYTLSDKASDAEAERLAEAENKADAIGGVNLTEEPTDVADLLIDLAQRETRTFSNRFARLLMSEMKTAARMHKHPLKSAGFKVLKAPDVPSVLVELGYVSNKADLRQMVSDDWRSRTVRSVAKAVEAFLAKRVVSAAPTH